MTSPGQKSNFASLLDIIQPFWIGGLSGMFATSVVQPIDMIKTVIQLKSESLAKLQGNPEKANFITAFRDVKRKDGLLGFYRGLDSALMRQVFYATTRLGVYKSLTEELTRQKKATSQHNLSLLQKGLCATAAGFLGSLIANPADLILIRMQADTQLPPNQQRNYRNFFDAFRRIAKEDGIGGLWRGATPTVVRAVVINIAMLASYDEVKEKVLSYFKTDKETMEVRTVASFIAGTLSSFCGLPFDNAKTKLQKMRALPDGSFPYKNIFDAMLKTASREGFTSLWVGYPTFYLRIAPHIVITLLVQDWITDEVKRYRAKI